MVQWYHYDGAGQDPSQPIFFGQAISFVFSQRQKSDHLAILDGHL